jgi:hypothetical protein
MRFKKGDFVEHILTGEKMIVVGCLENYYLGATYAASNLYSCRMASRLDIVFNFDESELREVGSERQ